MKKSAVPYKIRYPWTEWLKRSKTKITRGKDFWCMPHSMGVQIRTAARARNLRVKVEIDEDSITFYCTKVDGR